MFFLYSVAMIIFISLPAQSFLAEALPFIEYLAKQP